jgi:hypothetical protein
MKRQIDSDLKDKLYKQCKLKINNDLLNIKETNRAVSSNWQTPTIKEIRQYYIEAGHILNDISELSSSVEKVKNDLL